MPSERYEAMVAGVHQLREHLLPNPFDPTGVYSDEVLTRTLAFRVLAHAEIEAYLEDRALDASRTAVREFLANASVRRTLLALVSFSGLSMESAPDSLRPSQPTQVKTWGSKIELEEKLKNAANAFDRAVRQNHGIKETNILGLLLPVGVSPSDLDPVLLANISAFGEQRGLAAHSSTAVSKTRQPPDPESEYNTVSALLRDIAPLDLAIDALVK